MCVFLLSTQTPMVINITLIVTALVAVNFLLLKFSSNKTNQKRKSNKLPTIITHQATLDLEAREYGNTGS